MNRAVYWLLMQIKCSTLFVYLWPTGLPLLDSSCFPQNLLRKVCNLSCVQSRRSEWHPPLWYNGDVLTFYNLCSSRGELQRGILNFHLQLDISGNFTVIWSHLACPYRRKTMEFCFYHQEGAITRACVVSWAELNAPTYAGGGAAWYYDAGLPLYFNPKGLRLSFALKLFTTLSSPLEASFL